MSDALIPPPEVIYVETHKVACNGGGGALGHPLTYYELGEDGVVECGYCDRKFVHRDHAHEYADPSPRPEGDH
ncbi:MAG: zinc-finger domain-containing protein [Asticcacaulis sp.]|uniref:zinc-finger domain-containing protein n=1 Tax=Asticcacaulis sp. TaxID=1872648 RepID=UPI003F7BA184